MPNSRQREAIVSPSFSRITKRIRSSITELSFHGMPFALLCGAKCNPCLRNILLPMSRNGHYKFQSAQQPWSTGLECDAWPSHCRAKPYSGHPHHGYQQLGRATIPGEGAPRCSRIKGGKTLLITRYRDMAEGFAGTRILNCDLH